GRNDELSAAEASSRNHARRRQRIEVRVTEQLRVDDDVVGGTRVRGPGDRATRLDGDVAGEELHGVVAKQVLGADLEAIGDLAASCGDRGALGLETGGYVLDVHDAGVVL